MDANLIEDEFLRLRDLSNNWQVILEPQAQQLRLWFLACTGNDFFKDYSIGVSFEEKLVEFVLTEPKMATAPKDLGKRFDTLNRSVKWLLGEEFSVRVKAGRRRIYPKKEK